MSQERVVLNDEPLRELCEDYARRYAALSPDDKSEAAELFTQIGYTLDLLYAAREEIGQLEKYQAFLLNQHNLYAEN